MPTLSLYPTLTGERELHAQLEEWVAAGRMPLPPGFSLQPHLLPDDAPLPQPEGDVVYSTREIEFRARPDGGLVIVWRLADASASIHPERPAVDLLVSRRAIESGYMFFRQFMVCVLALTLKRSALYHLHAATLRDPTGDDWLMVGQSQCGKSTTTALLAARGWGVGTDDLAFLHDLNGRCVVTAWHDRIALRAGGQQLLQTAGGQALQERRKQGFFPEELGGTWVQTVDPRFLLFPVLGGDTTRLEPMTSQEALLELIPQSFWILFEKRGAGHYLELLNALAKQATAFRLHLAPDLVSRPGALRELLP